MATLNLFPARVRFVNDDGTLTPEAYRTLQVLFQRVGGALGDSGVDVFGQMFGAPTDSSNNLSNALSDVAQPENFGTDFYSDVVQHQASSKDLIGLMMPLVMQPTNDQSGVFSTLAVSENASIGGTLKLAAGTVGLPSLHWSTDTTTGFYRIGANNNGYSVSGVKLVDLLSTGVAITGTLSATGNLSTTGGKITLGNNTDYDLNIKSSATAATSVFANLIAGNAANSQLFFSDTDLNAQGRITYQHTDDTFHFFVGSSDRLTLATTGLAIAGTLSSTGALTTSGGATFHTTSTALTNGAGAGAGTITNAPAVGNPTKWIGINDNGTIRYLPSW